MYLKRLELQGFKSFAAKTQFDFAPGITAVVGPNGSGKSNVAESIRWVLGEQTARNVRARRLEDVIFSGSSQKAAVGMAEVSITLDNSEGWLPVDYSEVVVSRRAYRSGESEYLINKSRVRLRDVVELFSRAQVGQNSYAFMGQGLVDEVLVMRPEERRRLLEEAADVRLLRSSLDEARDRLSATRENLERVQLLLDEIGPRLAQLERQASRAEQHSKLARELAETLQELYSPAVAHGGRGLAGGTCGAGPAAPGPARGPGSGAGRRRGPQRAHDGAGGPREGARHPPREPAQPHGPHPRLRAAPGPGRRAHRQPEGAPARGHGRNRIAADRARRPATRRRARHRAAAQHPAGDRRRACAWSRRGVRR